MKVVFARLLVLFIIVVAFMFFRALVFEGSLLALTLGLLSGAIAFVAFGLSFRTLNLKEMGFRKKSWKKHIFLGCVIGFALYGFYRSYLFERASFQEPFLPAFTFDVAGALIVAVAVMSEELFFRGFAISYIRGETRTIGSCIISSLLFVLYHQSSIFLALIRFSADHLAFDSEQSLVLFLGGLLLSYLFVKTESLVLPVTTHLMWNLLVFSGSSFSFPTVFP